MPDLGYPAGVSHDTIPGNRPGDEQIDIAVNITLERRVLDDILERGTFSMYAEYVLAVVIDEVIDRRAKKLKRQQRKKRPIIKEVNDAKKERNGSPE